MRIDVKEKRDRLEFIMIYNEYRDGGLANMIAGGVSGGIIGGLSGFYFLKDTDKEYGLLTGCAVGAYLGAIILHSSLELIKRLLKRYGNPRSIIYKSDFF